MSTSVLIGRKELFAFADRYSSHRLRDYSELADGDVLCRLFSLVFPQYAIRPASPQTHSLTQRTLLNWEALFRGFARLHIPLALLDPVALARNDTEKGFSTLVLFYFLFHLSKKTDFSAEFAMDVSVDLTAFLQSIDSIASLLLGEAVEWESIPEELGGLIRDLPSFHVAPSQQEALEEAAAKQCRALLAPPAVSVQGSSVNSSVNGKNRAAARKGHRLSPPNAAAPSSANQSSRVPDTQVVSSLSFPKRAEGKHDDHSYHSVDPSRTETGGEAHSTASLQREDTQTHRERQGPAPLPTTSDTSMRVREARDGERLDGIHRRYVEKAKEVEALRGANIQLLSQVASLEAELDFTRSQHGKAETKAGELEVAVHALTQELEASHAQLAAVLQEKSDTTDEKRPSTKSLSGCGDDDEWAAEAEKAIDLLLEEVVDPNTGSPLDAHELANLLHCVLLEHMQDAPINRGKAQSWLWSIVTAYHVLENRLVTAVDAIEALQQRMASNAREGAERGGSMSDEWAALHQVEHSLRRRCAEEEAARCALATSAAARENLWRQLCASLHEAEKLSSEAVGAVVEAAEGKELDALLDEREHCYSAIDRLTNELKQVPVLPKGVTCPTRREQDSACWTVQQRAERAIADRVALEEQLAELKKQLLVVQRSPQLKDPTRSNERELTTPLPLCELAAAASSSRFPSAGSHHGTKTQPKTLEVTQNSSHKATSCSPPSAASSPYGKNLEALLAEATSPFEVFAHN